MAITTVFLTLALAVQTQPAPSADTVGRAYALFLQGRMLAESDAQAAVARFREALSLLGDSADIRAELANIYARQNQVAEARTEAERALVLDPDNRSAHRLMGFIEAAAVSRATGEDERTLLRRTITHFERALAGNFRDATVQLALADAYIRAERYQPAITVLNDFLLDRPDQPQALSLLALAYQLSGQKEQADAVAGRMLGERDAAGPSTRQAQRLEANGNWEEAAEAWEALAETEPDNAFYRLHQATALANSGQLDMARGVLNDLVRASPKEIAAYFLLVQVELRAGQPAAAEVAAARIGEIDPADPRGPLTLAEVRASQENHRGVVAALASRVSAASSADVESGAYAQMNRLLSQAYLGLKDEKRAVSTLETARKRAPEDRQVLFTLAATYEQTKQFDRAEKAFRDLIAAEPKHASGLNYLGYMLAERGRKLEEAVSLINRALEIDGDNPAYLDSLGWAYFKLARYTDALDPLERAARGAPDSSVIQEHLGDLYVKLKRFRDAEAAFSRALGGDGDGADLGVIRQKRDAARAMAEGR
jgi:tetratricopeptide (TPR) repeat protein